MVVVKSNAILPSSPPLVASIIKEFAIPLSLWTGRIAPVSISHALNGAVSGYISARKTRGTCAIISLAPSLWFFVAESLGFCVTHAWSDDCEFVAAMQSCFPTVVFESEARHVGGHNVDIVVGDYEGLCTIAENLLSAYWRWQTCPHLLVSSDNSQVTVPTTWTVHSETFCHAEMGGSTDGSDILHLCLPLHLATVRPPYPPLPSQPWTPMEASVNSVTSATPALPPSVSGTQSPAVSWSGLEIMPFGLFPSSHKSARVRVRCVFNVPSKWGSRSLTVPELSALWDVPILLQDRVLREFSTGLLHRFTQGVPGKTLLLGSDYLLSSRIRGVGSYRAARYV